MNRMSASASRVPPPPNAPKEVHDRFVEGVRREMAELEAEERDRRLSVAARVGLDVIARSEERRVGKECRL